MSTRVLIVDDSATMRALLSRLLGSEPDIEVIGAAENAFQARTMIREMNPDVITLDVEMPGMSGIEFLERIMRLRPMPVIIVSGVTRAGCETSVRALELGAVDVYAKPDGGAMNLLEHDGGKLADMVRAAAKVTGLRAHAALASERVRAAIAPTVTDTEEPVGAMAVPTKIIAIGSSTGGVEALHQVLPAFPADCPPTLIVQHISAAFAPAMAERLNGKCAATVRLAEAGIPLQQGHIYIAPGNDRHMVLATAGTMTLRLMPGDPVSGHRPSVDMMFDSVARLMGPAALGILLTGMGADGARGLLAIRNAGGRTIAQDEATSTVYGMPRAAADIGAAQKILPLPRIAERAFAGARG
jgi:two-component system, chemotaxis family, protein-glutamate methylesterase/glutaminase